MKIEDIKKEEIKKVVITIRTFPSYSKFMKTNKISPSKLFNKAVEELMKLK